MVDHNFNKIECIWRNLLFQATPIHRSGHFKELRFSISLRLRFVFSVEKGYLMTWYEPSWDCHDTVDSQRVAQIVLDVLVGV